MAAQHRYIVKFDPAGGHVWSKGFGSSTSLDDRGVTVDKAGFLVLGGEYHSMNPPDFGSGPVVSSGPAWNIFLAKLWL